MALKTFKPYTKSTRGTVLVDRKNLWKGKPLKSLTVGKISTGGRNNLGRITSRSRGAGTTRFSVVKPLGPSDALEQLLVLHCYVRTTVVVYAIRVCALWYRHVQTLSHVM